MVSASWRCLAGGRIFSVSLLFIIFFYLFIQKTVNSVVVSWRYMLSKVVTDNAAVLFFPVFTCFRLFLSPFPSPCFLFFFSISLFFVFLDFWFSGMIRMKRQSVSRVEVEQ